ncbi:hypothetical protein ACW5R3_01405 [Bizionia sp. KMM 8389]
MKKIKNCKYCNESFESRRSNHVYCNPSCRTKACLDRGGYKYVTGHFRKDKTGLALPKSELPVTSDLLNAIKALETKIESISSKPEINSGSISNAAIGSAAADATLFAAKKMFAPKTLPASKGDIDIIKQEIENLKLLLRMKIT